MSPIFWIAALVLLFLLLWLTLWYYRDKCWKDGVFDRRAFTNYFTVMISLGFAMFVAFCGLIDIYKDQLDHYRWPIMLVILLFSLYEFKTLDRKR